jgi:HlyD family secretion protein
MSEDKRSNLSAIIYKLTGGRRKWLIAAGSVIALAVLAMLLASSKNATSVPAKTLSTFKARRDNLTVIVTESGSIKARKSIDLKSEVEGRATIINIVPEGSYVIPEDVNNGKILVELDSGDLKEQLTQRQIDFTTADASYAQAKEAYDIQVKQNESDVTAAQLKVKFALMDFQKYLGETLANNIIETIDKADDPNDDIAALIDINNLILDPNNLGGEGSQSLNDWKDKIKMASASLANARYKLEGTQELFDANYVAKIELDRDVLERDSYEIQEKQALVSLNLFKLYEFPKQVQKLLSDYYESKRNLERTYAKARSQLAQAKAQLESAKARFDLQQDRLEKSKKQFAACTMKAPAPGLVVYGSSLDPFQRFRGAGIIAPGEQVYQRQTIISLPDTSEMMAEITVHESSVDKVKPGQKATIVMDAFPDQTFNGKVIKVAPLPDQQRNWLSPDIKVYTTQVSIEGTHDFLKPGMSARVEILVDYAADALVVPVQVVANRSGKKVCFVADGGKTVEKEVRTGLFNDTWVQILDGLNEGQEVMLNPPRITETKQEPAKQLADKFQKTEQQAQPTLAQAAETRPAMSDSNDQTREKMRQFREKVQRGEITFDPNQMDPQARERFKQFRSRMREQNADGAGSRQEP